MMRRWLLRGAVLLRCVCAAGSGPGAVAFASPSDCEASGSLTFAYFAVGMRTLTKARRSAVSAKRAHPAGRAQTLLLTDGRGVAFAKEEAGKCGGAGAFDAVIEIAAGANATAFSSMPEFVAFRTFVTAGKLESRHAPWTEKDNFNNKAVSDLRLAKIRSLEEALRRSRGSAAVVFLDADTVVCRPLLRYVCAMGDGGDVAFVKVPKEKNHAVLQLRETYGVTPDTPEANTGALFLRRTPKALSLLRYWGVRYEELRVADPPQLMDQVAFRAALHASRARWTAVPAAANCRGRDHQTRAHVPLACDGLASEVGSLLDRALQDRGSKFAKSDDPETSLKALRAAEAVIADLDGGRACDVLHTHEATDYRAPAPRPPGATKQSVCHWVDVPFAFETANARDVALAAARAALPACAELRRLPRHSGVDYGATPPGTLVAVLRDPVERVAAEFELCCVLNRGPREWCRLAVCEPGDKLGDYAERRGDAMLRALAPGEPCGDALRPPPNRADFRVVSSFAADFASLAVRGDDQQRAAYTKKELKRAVAATSLDYALVEAALRRHGPT